MTRNFAWAVAVTLAAAATTLAGPVPSAWTLKSAISTQMGGDGLEVGPFIQSGPTGEPVTVMGTVPLPAGMAVTEFAGDDGRVRVATAGKGGYTLSEFTPIDARDTVFTLTLTLTDAASGTSGDLTFTGRPALLVGPDLGSPAEVTLGFEGPGSGSVTLGGRRYDVTLGTDESDSGSYLTADVTCTHETPEPATLALAAVGLLGAAGGRRVRRG